ncbi:MAG: amidohydrolase, partial [Ilumatobacteraceae bacterium]
GTAIHTEDFARFAGSESGDAAVLVGAKAMALTVVDLWTNANLLADVRREFASVTSSVDVLA